MEARFRSGCGSGGTGGGGDGPRSTRGEEPDHAELDEGTKDGAVGDIASLVRRDTLLSADFHGSLGNNGEGSGDDPHLGGEFDRVGPDISERASAMRWSVDEFRVRHERVSKSRFEFGLVLYILPSSKGSRSLPSVVGALSL
jgi:hypothetical protein